MHGQSTLTPLFLFNWWREWRRRNTRHARNIRNFASFVCIGMWLLRSGVSHYALLRALESSLNPLLGGGGGGMLGMLGTFPVLSPVDGGGWDLGSRVDITSREGVRIGGTWDRGSRLDITFSPYTRSNLSTDFASVATRSIQRCI